MGTTVYFEGEVKDKGGKSSAFIEVGKTSYDEDGAVLYLVIDDKTICMDEETARKLCAGFASTARYLGIEDA